LTRDELVDSLRREHPKWRIWASDVGRFYGVRYGLQPGAPGQGLTVHSGTATGLDEMIAQAQADAASYSSSVS
jgi:hypothetical protein